MLLSRVDDRRTYPMVDEPAEVNEQTEQAGVAGFSIGSETERAVDAPEEEEVTAWRPPRESEQSEGTGSDDDWPKEY
jgi:hypothetical protein